MQFFPSFHFSLSLCPIPHRHKALFILITLLFIPACAEKKMSLREAKQVTVSMAGKSFVPPPRRVDNILNMLDQKGKFDPIAIEELRKSADFPPPEIDDPAKLAQFYLIRGCKARDLCRWNQYLEDHHKALEYCRNAKKLGRRTLLNKEYARLLLELSIAEVLVGNVEKAIVLMKQCMSVNAFNPAIEHRLLAGYYWTAGNLKTGVEIAETGIDICNRKLNSFSLSQFATKVYEREKALIQSKLMEIRGDYEEAVHHARVAVSLLDKQFRVENRKLYWFYKRDLGRLLANQGKFVDAEIQLREVLTETIGLGGKNSAETGRTLQSLGSIFRLQGRLEDAEKVLLAGIKNIEASDISEGSRVYVSSKEDLAGIYVSKGDFPQAMIQYDTIRSLLIKNGNPSLLNSLEENPDLLIAFLKTDRVEEAAKLINKSLSKYIKYLGGKDFLRKENYRTALMLGLQGIAFSLLGNDEQAMNAFSSSIPLLLKRETSSIDYVKGQRLKIIVDAYLDLLDRIHNRADEKGLHNDASEEIFKLCASLNRSMVRNALGASGARAAAGEEELADLVRKEQDSSKQIETFNNMLSNALAAPSDQQNSEGLADLKSTIDSLITARAIILDEINRGFPKYADFVNPQTPDFQTIQASLNPKEAMIVLYPAQDKTYVWGIPKQGKVAFAVVPLGKDELQDKTLQLRRTLSPVPETFGDIPAFNLDLAYDLYAALIEPVKAGWKNAEDLIVVTSGPLGQIPFSVFPTKLVNLEKGEELLFEKYRGVPWLIKKCSITRLPSVSSLMTLRNLPEGDETRKAFLGFGDPYFNTEQMEQGLVVKKEQNRGVSNNSISQRGVRALVATGTDTLDNEKLISSHIGMLSRLPDTAEEITGIAETLEADLTQDIFLREKATEGQAKSIDMTNRKVIAFATHGLVPGTWMDWTNRPWRSVLLRWLKTMKTDC